MAGIYIHIPFCKQKCHYCNFYSLASKKNAEAFVDALLIEIKTRHSYLMSEPVKTIYFGGGTPSILGYEAVLRIFEQLNAYFSISSDVEITFETNPDDISARYLSQLKAASVNRLSIGIQSFFSDDLQYLNRVHSETQAKVAIETAKNAGFEKLTIDLIYGIPTLTHEKWKHNLEMFFQSGLTHLSAYALTVESKTALAHLIEKGKYLPVDETQSVEQFEILLQKMEENGFVHYEISNFALPGFYSKHNSLYWLGGNYLGFGPSAHSFNGISRQWNVSNLAQYIQHAGLAASVAEKEVLTKQQKYNEYVMTSLRTSWGCDLEHIENVFGKDYKNHCLAEAQKYIIENQLRIEKNQLLLTNKGKFFADGIAAALFTD